MTNIQHSMATPEHGSPTKFVELGLRALFPDDAPDRRFDLDPASNGYWNHHLVKARCFYDQASGGLARPWFGRMWINPPGGKDPATGRSLVRAFWDRLLEHIRVGAVHSAVWLGYSLEQLVQLQSAAMHPLQFFTLIPSERIEFMTRPPQGGPPIPNTSPTHGNYITLVQTRTNAREAAQQVHRFLDAAARLEVGGAIVRPL